MDYDQTIEVLAALERESVSYAVFGGVALNLHGLARATEDLDLFVRPTEENIDRLRAALDSVFDDPHLQDVTAEDLLGDYPAIKYAPPVEGFCIDILTRIGSAFQFEDLETERIELSGLKVSVVTAAMLYRMKKDTVRPRDRADAERLRQHFEFEE